MKKIILGFIHKGFTACGFGPIIWAIVYFFLEKNGVVEVLEIRKAVVEIVTVTLLAFIAGGINIVYHIEQLPLMAAISAHGIVLYLDYTIIDEKCKSAESEACAIAKKHGSPSE